MFWRGLGMAGVIMAGLAAVGCFNSEAEYQALLEDCNTLSAELAEARRENEILTRALDNIKGEQETLQLLLSFGKSALSANRVNPPAAVTASGQDLAAVPGPGEDRAAQATTVAAPAASDRYYTTKPGDVLIFIAQAHNTTVPKLLDLNPKLRNRPNYMIYDNESLRLP